MISVNRDVAPFPPAMPVLTCQAAMGSCRERISKAANTTAASSDSEQAILDNELLMGVFANLVGSAPRTVADPTNGRSGPHGGPYKSVYLLLRCLLRQFSSRLGG